MLEHAPRAGVHSCILSCVWPVLEREQERKNDIPGAAGMRKVVTETCRAEVFWPAEAYHRTPTPGLEPGTCRRPTPRDFICARTAVTRCCPRCVPAERYLQKGGQSAAKEATEAVRCYG